MKICGKLILLSLLALSVSACDFSGMWDWLFKDDKSGYTNPLPANTHAVELGPITGATVTVYRPDCQTSLYQTTTDKDGLYQVPPNQIEHMLGSAVPDILCIEAIGGIDVDPNDDGIRDQSEFVQVQGKIRGYVRTDDLLSGDGTRLNLFGAAIADLIGASDDLSTERIEALARQLAVPDVDGDGAVTIQDVTRYEMGSRVDDEAPLRGYYLRSIHEGNTADRQFFVDVTAADIRGVRQIVESNGNGSGTLSLVPFSKDAIIHYGDSPSQGLPYTYTTPLLVYPGDIVYAQECLGETCIPMQAVQINKDLSDITRYADSEGVNLEEFYAGLDSRESILTELNSVTGAITDAQAKITESDLELARLNAEKAAYEAEIERIKAEIADLTGA